MPVSSPSTALPAASLDQKNIIGYWANSLPSGAKVPNPIVMESQDLGGGRICFIRGNRMASGIKAEWKVNIEGPLERNAGGFSGNQEKWAIPRTVGNGIERQEQLCSFEYLERYFAVVLRRRSIALQEELEPADYDSGLLGKYSKDDGATSSMFFGGGGKPTLGNMPDIANNHATKMRGAAPTWGGARDEAGKTLLQGIFAHDIHPFLRGKGNGPSQLVPLGIGGLGGGNRASISRLEGDTVAFAALYQKMLEIGLLDWLPDGIVLSKDHVGPDQAADDSFDARLGQLFNVAVQGPAICTSYAGNYKLKTMPGDKVFVLIIADVHYGHDTLAAMLGADAAMNGFIGKSGASGDAANFDAYVARRLELMPSVFNNSAKFTDFLARAKDDYAANNQVLTNFRIRLSTSSEMLHTSGVNLAGLAANGDVAAGYALKDTERMGLRIGTTMGEYIVGGFCIGTVLDSAASRAALPGQFAVKSDTATYALNVYVKTEWWSGDKLYRAYCDVGQSLEPRYQTKNLPSGDLYKHWSDAASPSVKS